MRKLLLASALALAGVLGTIGRTEAWEGEHCGPWAATAAFPHANPPGWYTNTYSFAWYYPWYAYYNFSHGPYANWAVGGGYATYGLPNRSPLPAIPVGLPSLVTINLPADAKLLFSGTIATGTGAIRSFATPPLEPNQEYTYEMTAEVVKDGRTLKVTKIVSVRAGDNVNVTLEPVEPELPK